MGKVVIAVLFPAIVAAIFLASPVALARFFVLRRHGEGDDYKRFRRRCQIFLGACIAASYALFIIGLFFQDVFPAWTAFLAEGKLAMFVVPGILLDILVGQVFNKPRALRSYERRKGASEARTSP